MSFLRLTYRRESPPFAGGPENHILFFGRYEYACNGWAPARTF